MRNRDGMFQFFILTLRKTSKQMHLNEIGRIDYLS